MKENIKSEKKDKNSEEKDESDNEIKTDAIKIDLLTYIGFIGFLSCVFYIAVGQFLGMYPFVPDGEWVGESFIGSGVILLANPPLLYAIYWIGLLCLALGLYRIKLEWYLVLSVAVFGAAIFFAFFIQIYN